MGHPLTYAGGSIISYDLRLLGHLEQVQPGAGAQLVETTGGLGLHVFAGDVSQAAHWHFGAALGVEALHADDVPLAMSLQPPLDSGASRGGPVVLRPASADPEIPSPVPPSTGHPCEDTLGTRTAGGPRRWPPS